MEGITRMTSNFLKRLLGGKDEQTVVIQEIIEGGAPLAGEVRTDPTMVALPPLPVLNGLNGLNGVNQTHGSGAQPPALFGTQPPATSDGQRGGGSGPLDLMRGAARGIWEAAQSAGGKAAEFGQTQEGRELATSLAGLMTIWLSRSTQLTEEQRQAITDKLREDFADFIRICGDVANSMNPAERASSYALMDAFNRLVPVSDELRAAAMAPIGTGPLPVVPKKPSAATSDEDQVVRKLTEVPKHTPRTLAELARQLEADAQWAAQQLQRLQTDLQSDRARREVMMNDARNRTQSLSKELLARLKRLRKDLCRERGWFENWRGSLGQ